jgi:hypothetical protein
MAVMEKVSNWTKFFNQVALSIIVGTFAIGIVWVLATEMWSSYKLRQRHAQDNVIVKAPINNKGGKQSEMTLNVGNIRKVGNIWIANIEEPGDSYNEKIVYRSSNTITRNLVISPVKSDKARLLFNDYNNKFISLQALPDSESTNVIVCRYVKNYSNETDEAHEKISLMLLSPDAAKQKTIIEDIDRVLKVETNGKNEIYAIYFKDGKLINARYSLKDYSLISQPTIFDLNDVNLQNVNLVGES